MPETARVNAGEGSTMMGHLKLRHLFCAAWVLNCLATFCAAAVDLDTRTDFHIPAGRLSSGLIQFSAQAHVQVLTSGEAADVMTAGVSGVTTLRDALTR